jgi:dual oxidase
MSNQVLVYSTFTGTADDKAKLMFDMYDINGTGQLTLEDFKNMIT